MEVGEQHKSGFGVDGVLDGRSCNMPLATNSLKHLYLGTWSHVITLRIFGMRGDVGDTIIHTKFCDSRFRGFRVLISPILPFSIGLAGSPHNSINSTVLHCDNSNL